MCTIIHSFLVLNNNHNNVILFKFLDYHRIFRTFVKDAKDSSYFCCCALLGDIFFFVCFCFYFYTFSIGFLKPCYRLFLFFFFLFYLLLFYLLLYGSFLDRWQEQREKKQQLPNQSFFFSIFPYVIVFYIFILQTY